MEPKSEQSEEEGGRERERRKRWGKMQSLFLKTDLSYRLILLEFSLLKEYINSTNFKLFIPQVLNSRPGWMIMCSAIKKFQEYNCCNCLGERR
jgi:hypothetical protein